jgi:hypothetical protein
MNVDWLTMTEEEKYVEWSEYVTTPGLATMEPSMTDYSEYCDWMDAWERTHG